jgi:hypothetical protein
MGTAVAEGRLSDQERCMSRLGDWLGRPGSEELRTPCLASGWQVRNACTNGAGQARRPVCAAAVDTPPSVRHGPAVRVIAEHATPRGRQR